MKWELKRFEQMNFKLPEYEKNLRSNFLTGTRGHVVRVFGQLSLRRLGKQWVNYFFKIYGI